MADGKSYIHPGSGVMQPHLYVDDVAGAIAWYQRVFGAEVAQRLSDPSGAIVHAALTINGAPLDLAAETADGNNRSPKFLGGSPVVIALYVEDVDAVYQRAVAAGARVVYPLRDQFYGDRSGRVADPFGHLWILATYVEEVSPEEQQRRLEAGE